MADTTTFNLVLTAPIKTATQIVRDRLATDDVWVIRALISIYECQTADEQESKTTSHMNGCGFTGLDAQFGSSLAEQAIKRGTLSEKQMVYARKMMKKYAGQLVRIARAKVPQ